MRRAFIRLGVDPDGLDPELATRADDPDGDLAAIRDQETADHAVQEGLRFSRNARSPS